MEEQTTEFKEDDPEGNVCVLLPHLFEPPSPTTQALIEKQGSKHKMSRVLLNEILEYRTQVGDLVNALTAYKQDFYLRVRFCAAVDEVFATQVSLLNLKLDYKSSNFI
jgi:hypothetical protein